MESGYRAILSFKLFVKDTDKDEPWGDNIFSKMADSMISKISDLNGTLGIILKHHYGYNSQSIYGCDKLLFDRLSQQGFKMDIHPVLIRLKGREKTSAVPGTRANTSDVLFTLLLRKICNW